MLQERDKVMCKGMVKHSQPARDGRTHELMSKGREEHQAEESVFEMMLGPGKTLVVL